MLNCFLDTGERYHSPELVFSRNYPVCSNCLFKHCPRLRSTCVLTKALSQTYHVALEKLLHLKMKQWSVGQHLSLLICSLKMTLSSDPDMGTSFKLAKHMTT